LQAQICTHARSNVAQCELQIAITHDRMSHLRKTCAWF
jgi:hypothetical protein